MKKIKDVLVKKEAIESLLYFLSQQKKIEDILAIQTSFIKGIVRMAKRSRHA